MARDRGENDLISDSLLSDLGIERIVHTISSATGTKVEVTEQTEVKKGYQDPRVVFGPQKDKGYTQTTKTYTIPIKERQGRVLENIIADVWRRGQFENNDYIKTFEVLGEKPGKKQVLQDRIQIVISQRSDLPGESQIQISTEAFKPAPEHGRGVFRASINHSYMNVEQNAVNRQPDLIRKITTLLENLSK